MIWFAILLALSACAPNKMNFKKDRADFEASIVKMRFKSVSELNDSYFEIRENNYFYYYRALYDSLHNTQFPGRFTKNGDTLVLNFYSKKGSKMLGSKALISSNQNEIIFFDSFPGPTKKWLIFQ